MVDKFKIAQALEKEQEQEEQKTIHQLAESDLQSIGPGKEDGKNILIMIGVLVGIFVLTLGGFKLYNQFTAAGVVVLDDLHTQNLEGELDQDQGYVYNGFSVVKADGLWWTEVEIENRLIKIPLHFGPKEVEQVPVLGNLDSGRFNSGNKIYMAIDPNVNYNKYYTLALMELNNNILQGVNKNIEAACTEDHPVCENRTVINCNTAQGMPVVELSVSENSEVELLDTCIKVSGDGYDLVKAADRLLYRWYGVMS